MKLTCRILLIALLFILLQSGVLYSEVNNILVINSYHEGYHWTDQIMKGVHSVFHNQDDTELFIEYMDTKRISDSDYLEQLADLYLRKYQNLRIDAILASDDHALDFIIKYEKRLFPEIPVVFCGINDYHPSRTEGYEKVTGVYEAYDVSGTIDLMRRLHPDARRIAVVLDETLSGEAFHQLVLKAEKKLPPGLSLQYLYQISSEDLERSLRELPPDSLILWAIYLRTPEGKYISSSESIRLVRSFSDLPIYCIWDVIGQGVVGGKITKPFIQGEVAADMVMKILKGEDVRSIPVKGSSQEYLFDYRELQRFGLSEKMLPPDSTVINKPHSIIHEYRSTISSVIIILLILSFIIVALIWDIQMRKKAERALLISQEQLAHSRKMDAIGQLAGGIAHDFNNILTGIMGAAEVLKSDKRNLDDLSLSFIDIILKASRQASDLTAKLLAFGRKGRSLFSLIDMHKVIDDSEAILSQTLNRNIELLCKTGAENHSILGDKSSMQNVIINLAINASQAMPDGGTIRITTSNVKLDPDYCKKSAFEIASGLFLELSVKDSGSGISADQMKKIFEPFFTTKGEGSGLGLAAVYGSVQDHHGAITIQSEVGLGSEFSIFLPVSTDSISREDDQKIECGTGTVLLIDDDEIVLATVKQQLEDCGYSVYTADDRKSALDLYRPNQKGIDMVVLDMIMPKTSGQELFFELKGINPDCKIIIFSGYVKKIKIETLWKNGLCGFLQKPFTKKELIDLLNKYI